MFDLIVPMVASAALSASVPIGPHSILITNDDGLTSNVVALYRTLKAAGYDVVVSVPCTNQSGTGAAIRIAASIPRITANCRAGAAMVGDPGAGPMTKRGYSSDCFYVDGTPVMALLYGLDVVAARRWHHAPDLVLSGPNEGRNVGRLTISSGTVGAAQFAALRGIPAIALSAGDATNSGDGVDNPASVPVAQLATRLVSALGRQAGRRPLIPRSVVLNVNFPDDPTHARWRLAQVGTYEAYTIGFVGGASAIPANATGVPSLPGIRVGRNAATPRADQMTDEAVLARRDITISVLNVGYGGRQARSTGLDLDHLVRSMSAEGTADP